MKKFLIIIIVLLFPFNAMAYENHPTLTINSENNYEIKQISSNGNQFEGEKITLSGYSNKEFFETADGFQCVYKSSGYAARLTYTSSNRKFALEMKFDGSAHPDTPFDDWSTTIDVSGYKILVTNYVNVETVKDAETCPNVNYDINAVFSSNKNGSFILSSNKNVCAYKINYSDYAHCNVYVDYSSELDDSTVTFDCPSSMVGIPNSSNKCFNGYVFKNNCPKLYAEIKPGTSSYSYLGIYTGECVNNVIIPGQENDRYSDVETCTDVDVNHIKACGCIPAEVADITSKVYFILRLIGPILLLIIGGFEMAKAIAAQDESAIEKAKKKLVNKFIAAAAIFLVLTVIKLAVSLVAENTPGIFECVNILLDGYVI